MASPNSEGQSKTGPQTEPGAGPGGPGFASVIGDLSGFGRTRKGGYKTYREMSGDPTVALAQAVVFQPVIRSSWGWQVKDGAPAEAQAWKAKIEAVYTPIRDQYVRDALKSLVYGWAGAEKVWGVVDGIQCVTRWKPLRWEKTEILGDPGGDWAGLRNTSQLGTIDLPPLYSHLISYDSECGDLYGRSRHENIRKWWSRGEEVAERFAQYLKKVSGIIFQLHYPDSGTSKDAAGADRPNWWLAKDLLDKVSSGSNVAIANKFAAFLTSDDGTVTPAALEKALAAAGKSDWVFSFLDPKGPDLAPGFLESLAYFDKLKFRGWLRPERTALEAQRGGIGHGDAEQHSEVATHDCEGIANDLATSFNKNVVDDTLVANWGERARGMVYAEAAPLIDTTVDNAFKLLGAAFASQAAGPVLTQKINWDALLEDVEVPVYAVATKDGVQVIPPSVVQALQPGQQPPIRVNSPPVHPQPAQPQPPQRKLMSKARVRRAARLLMKDGADVLA